MTVIWQPALTEEAKRWQTLADRVTQEHFAPLAEEIDREQRYPWESVRRLVEHNLAGLFIPKKYGGQSASLGATVAVVETIGTGCASTAAILCAYQLGAFPVLLAGREDQKQLYLGDMVKGVATSFALSERSTGSDAAAIEATATREGDGWRLRGEKFWIGNGGASRYYVVFAKTDPAAGGRGISAFMVDKEQSGVVIDGLADKMGIRGTQTSNSKARRRGARQRARRRTELSAAPCLSDTQYRARHGRCPVPGPGACRLSRGIPARCHAARVRPPHHREPGNRFQARRHGGCRDQRVLQIYEGTSEIQRLVLARAVRQEAEEAIAASAKKLGARSA